MSCRGIPAVWCPDSAWQALLALLGRWHGEDALRRAALVHFRAPALPDVRDYQELVVTESAGVASPVVCDT